jgi:DNA-binding PadR family transcriptional regulator
MVYDVLATLWERPASGIEIARAVEDRTGLPISRNQAEEHLRLLRTCGYIAARDGGGAPHYSLTADGSALLAQLAETIESTETH